jgi:hypothetical protein
MSMWSRWGLAGVAAVFGAALLFAGCGSGEGSATTASVATGKQVMRCALEHGAAESGGIPALPKGFPSSQAEEAMITGPQNDDLGIYVSRHSIFTSKVAKGFDRLGEFHAEVLAGGRALLLFRRGYLTIAERELSRACIEG